MRYLEYDPRFNHPSDKFGPLLAMNVGSVFGATGLTVMLLPMLGLRTLRNHKVLTLRIGQTILMLGPLPACVIGTPATTPTLLLAILAAFCIAQLFVLWSPAGEKMYRNFGLEQH